jgi:hypothetical protein
MQRLAAVEDGVRSVGGGHDDRLQPPLLLPDTWSAMRTLTLACLAAAASLSAAVAQPLTIPWFTIDGGGGLSSGASLSVGGTIGQHDAGAPMHGGRFSVLGGFWEGLPSGIECPCAADYNRDGGIDGTDVAAFFDDWEGGAACADVNQDGGIDGGDMEVFFALWEAGGC